MPALAASEDFRSIGCTLIWTHVEWGLVCGIARDLSLLGHRSSASSVRGGSGDPEEKRRPGPPPQR
jgi:hypothetical protein